MKALRFEDAEVRSGTGRTLLGPITMTIDPGTTLVACGSTGAGKSLLLELASGMRRPDSGTVRLGDRDVHRIPPARRGIGLLTQDAALYDHLGVQANIAFGLPAVDPTRVEQAATVADCRDLLTGDRGRCGTLSGGERRRVALAKAIAPAPPCLLLDEPLAGLDPIIRQAVRSRLAALLEASDGLAVLALHDFEDAVVLGDRVAIIDGGRLLQVGTCEDLMERPGSARIAARLQNPPGCSLPGRIEGGQVLLPGGRLPLAEPTSRTGAVEVMIPPHAMRVAEEGLSGWIVVSIEKTRDGADLLVSAPLDAGTDPRALLRVRQEDDCHVTPGSEVTVTGTIENRFVFGS
ncbi:MAG: ABC transporter ATP-binding protein [Planctomycetota bacterium]|nr:ABC transporter ATP-binding protein [Planctomycetota bacterium]